MRNIWMNCSYQGNLRTRARRTSSLGLFLSQSTWARVVSSSFWGKLKSRKRTAGRFPFSPGDDGALRSCLLSSISTVSRSVWAGPVRREVYIFAQEPIIHGNLTCDTIFIQHNGLVKIGSVAPDAIHKNVKTFRENIKNFHFLAPEWAGRKKP